MDKIRVYALRVNKDGKPCKGYFMEIDNDAEAWKDFVGGWPSEIRIRHGVVVICDEDGKLKNYSPNRAISRNGHLIDYFVGDIFVCRRGEDSLASINDLDIPLIEETLLPIWELREKEVLCRPADTLPDYEVRARKPTVSTVR